MMMKQSSCAKRHGHFDACRDNEGGGMMTQRQRRSYLPQHSYNREPIRDDAANK